MDYYQTLLSILILLALAIPGFILKKIKLLNDNASKNLVNLTLFVAQPAIVIYSFQKEQYDSTILNNIFWTFGLSFIFLSLIILLTSLIIKPFTKDQTQRKIIVFGATFGNSIFMGFPIINMLVDDKTGVLIYLSIFAMAFNIISWTYGAFLLSGDKKYISLKNIILNPPTLTALLMLPLFFANIRFPGNVLEVISYVANMAVPLSMTVFGIKLTEIKFKDIFNDKDAYLATAIKLLIGPFLVYLFLKFMPWEIAKNLKIVLYILFLMPSASTLILFVEKFNLNSNTATKAVLLSTLLSCITLPLLLLLPL